jgi:signal transduction histidine kinase
MLSRSPVLSQNVTLRPSVLSLRRLTDVRQARIANGRHDLHLARREPGNKVAPRSQQDRQDAACATAVADDRERMAEDLYDTVIHRLFAAGLQLQATCQHVDPAEQHRLEATIDLLDITITELRKAIFSLH